jgi:hypothetical protein
VDEIMGQNDGSKPHSPLILQGHDHNVQLMYPQGARGAYPGLTSVVVGLCATAPATHAGRSGQTSQKSWLQFANISPRASAFLQIDIGGDGSLDLTLVDASDTSGNPLQNTPHTGVTGSPSTRIRLA